MYDCQKKKKKKEEKNFIHSFLLVVFFLFSLLLLPLAFLLIRKISPPSGWTRSCAAKRPCLITWEPNTCASASSELATSRPTTPAAPATPTVSPRSVTSLNTRPKSSTKRWHRNGTRTACGS